MLERTSLSRPSHHLSASRPFGRLRMFAGRHRTLWRVFSAATALVLAFAWSPGAAETPAPDLPADAAEVTDSSPPDLPAEGLVGVALPRTSAFPALAVGDIVHGVAVNDPLVSGELRETIIVVRDARVLTSGDAAVTIEVSEAEALALVEATTTGAVVLVTTGTR